MDFRNYLNREKFPFQINKLSIFLEVKYVINLSKSNIKSSELYTSQLIGYKIKVKNSFLLD